VPSYGRTNCGVFIMTIGTDDDADYGFNATATLDDADDTLAVTDAEV